VRSTRWLWTVLLFVGLAACSADVQETGGRAGTPSGSPSTTWSATQTPTPSPTPSPTPRTRRERIRAVLRDQTPNADEVIALAKTPMAWTRARDTLLVEYWLTYPGFWPESPAVVATQVRDRRGKLLGEWVEDADAGAPSYWPAGRDLVGLTWSGDRPVLVRDGSPTPLTRVRGTRAKAPGDIRFGRGWLLDPAAKTVTRERLPGCRQDSIRTDLRGRVWCLDHPKEQIAWSADDGRTWTRHTLSDSYFDYCDGGALGSDLEVRDDVVAIGLWRADFSLDRGATWHDVPLPWRLVGLHHERPLADNCTQVTPLRDGRLVIGYYRFAVATDATNTRFKLIYTPRHTRFANVQEGVVVAVSRRPYGETFVSYDGAETWLPLRLPALLGWLSLDPWTGCCSNGVARRVRT
jgi:hypothetical protein